VGVQDAKMEIPVERKGTCSMNLGITLLAVLSLGLAAVPSYAQTLYENGAINGNTDAWPFVFGYIVSDTFTLSSNSTVGGFEFGMWEFPSSTLTSVDWSITSMENGGTTYGSGTVAGNNLTQTYLSTNSYGYFIYEITATGLNVGLTGGTYWLNLTNAEDNGDVAVYWDENSGAGCQSSGCPSQASTNQVGTIASESFTINGTGGGTTPEPGSFVLMVSGVLGLAGVLRWKRGSRQ
jgi:hypothetical protein